MEEAHRLLAKVVGELSLAIVDRKAQRIQLLNWAGVLRKVAQMFEDKANGR